MMQNTEAENCDSWQAGSVNVLTFLLENRLEQYMYYRKSCRLWYARPAINLHYMTDILQSMPCSHARMHVRTQCTHTDLHTSPPSAPKQIIAFTQPDINLFRLACVLKGTTTTTTAAAAAAVNSSHISCTSQILVGEGEREKTTKGAVKQNGDASCLSATECEEMWQSAGGGFQIHFLLLSVHISRWRRICWFLLCSIMEGRWMWMVEGGVRWWWGRLAGAHMPKNDASPLICSSVSHMNSSAARHARTHTHTHIQSIN